MIAAPSTSQPITPTSAQLVVAEDRAVLGLAGVQAFQHLVAAGAEGLGRRIQVEAVTALVLHLGNQDGLCAWRLGARDPVASGSMPDDPLWALADLAHEGLGDRPSGIQSWVRCDRLRRYVGLEGRLPGR